MPEPSLRLFFALWPDEALRRRIAEHAHAYVRAGRGREIPAVNFHVTVLFLGSVPQSRLPALAEAAGRLREPAFELVLERIEHWTRSRLVCLTARTPPELQGLAQSLRSQLAAYSFAQEGPPLRAHVTLARDVSGRQPPIDIPPLRWPVGEFTLAQSRPMPGGSEYLILGRWALHAAGGKEPHADAGSGAQP